MVKRLLPIVIIAACVPAVAMAAAYPDGAGKDFSWTNMSDMNARFGMPLATGASNDIFFPGANFTADDPGGVASVSDTLMADLTANSGLRFNAITFITRGTRTLTGTTSSVSGTGMLVGTGLVGDAFNDTSSYLFTDNTPPEANTFWTDQTMITVPLTSTVTSLHIDVTQDLVAVAGDGTAQITATFQIVGIAVSVVPEPTSLALIGLGGLVLLRKKGARI